MCINTVSKRMIILLGCLGLNLLIASSDLAEAPSLTPERIGDQSCAEPAETSNPPQMSSLSSAGSSQPVVISVATDVPSGRLVRTLCPWYRDENGCHHSEKIPFNYNADDVEDICLGGSGLTLAAEFYHWHNSRDWASLSMF